MHPPKVRTWKEELNIYTLYNNAPMAKWKLLGKDLHMHNPGLLYDLILIPKVTEEEEERTDSQTGLRGS